MTLQATTLAKRGMLTHFSFLRKRQQIQIINNDRKSLIDVCTVK
jgi:hypothetical protein